MKPGDIVRLRHSNDLNPRIDPLMLFGGSEYPWKDNDSQDLIPAGIQFGHGDLGVVLSRVRDPLLVNDVHYVKLITPGGIGWAYEGCLEIVR